MPFALRKRTTKQASNFSTVQGGGKRLALALSADSYPLFADGRALAGCTPGAASAKILYMAELFLSYAHEDVKFAETLAALLQANHLDVWWDRRMVPGEQNS